MSIIALWAKKSTDGPNCGTVLLPDLGLL